MDFIIGFIIWICLALLVGKFWQNKGRSFGAGLILSIILSPLIGLLVGVLIAPNIKQQEENKIDAGVMKKCPSCAELVKIAAIVCRYCGNKFEVSENTTIDMGLGECSECGFTVSETAKQCPNCKALFDEADDT